MPRQHQLFFAQRVAGGVQTGQQSLRGGLLVAGGAVELPGTVDAAHDLAFQRGLQRGGCLLYTSHANCKFAYTPKSRIAFWNKKFSSNISRDLVVHNQLLNDNIKCLVIWECCVKSMQKDALYEENMLTIIRNFLHSVDMYMELPAKPD